MPPQDNANLPAVVKMLLALAAVEEGKRQDTLATVIKVWLERREFINVIAEKS